MPICRICQYNNPSLAIACHQCGVHLDQDVLQGNITPLHGIQIPQSTFTLTISADNACLEIFHDTIVISNDHHIYVGRDFPPQFSNTYMELGPYDARSYGVSRIHARIEKDLYLNYCVVDLGSTNGTLLNNELLTAFHSYQLTNNDLLSFGNFPIYVQFNA